MAIGHAEQRLLGLILGPLQVDDEGLPVRPIPDAPFTIGVPRMDEEREAEHLRQPVGAPLGSYAFSERALESASVIDALNEIRGF